VVGPAASKFVCPLDGGLHHVHGHIGPFRLEVRVFLPPLVVLLNEIIVDWPSASRWVVEVIVCVDSGDDALGVIFPDGVWRNAKRERTRKRHFLEHVIAERLLIESDVIAAPYRREKKIRLLADCVSDVRGKVRRT